MHIHDLVIPVIAIQDPLGQLPSPASTFAADVDPLFNFLLWVSLFFFGLILAILVTAAVRFRRRTPDQEAASSTTHNTALEVVWTLVPTIILMVTFAWGLKGNLVQQIAPADARSYYAEASQWAWAFYHPGDDRADPQSAAEDIYVEVGKPARITMTSRDVLHSLFVPAMRAKRDVVPGVRQLVWFTPTATGEYDLYCAEYCGDGHSKMRRKVHVVDAETFESKPWVDIPQTPEARGEKWYTTLGCAACHTLDGSQGIGPTWEGLWMREGQLDNGESYTADEEYIRESVREPNAKIVAGFNAGQMVPYPESNLSEEMLDDLIAFIKELQ